MLGLFCSLAVGAHFSLSEWGRRLPLLLATFSLSFSSADPHSHSDRIHLRHSRLCSQKKETRFLVPCLFLSYHALLLYTMFLQISSYFVALCFWVISDSSFDPYPRSETVSDDLVFINCGARLAASAIACELSMAGGDPFCLTGRRRRLLLLHHLSLLRIRRPESLKKACSGPTLGSQTSRDQVHWRYFSIFAKETA